MLEWQRGDCVDLSVLLVSLLTSCGYDAYVVLGTAPKVVCCADQSRRECKITVPQRLGDVVDAPAQHSKYKPTPRPNMISEYEALKAKQSTTKLSMREIIEKKKAEVLQEVRKGPSVLLMNRNFPRLWMIWLDSVCMHGCC